MIYHDISRVKEKLVNQMPMLISDSCKMGKLEGRKSSCDRSAKIEESRLQQKINLEIPRILLVQI